MSKQSLVARKPATVPFKCSITSPHSALAARFRPSRFQLPMRELDQRRWRGRGGTSVHDAVPARTDQRRCSRCPAYAAISDYQTHPTCGSNGRHLLRRRPSLVANQMTSMVGCIRVRWREGGDLCRVSDAILWTRTDTSYCQRRLTQKIWNQPSTVPSTSCAPRRW